MSEHTNISWTDSTFNPWRGCTKVSAGCANCYAEQLVTTRMRGEWGKGKPRQLASDKIWKDPVKWNKEPWICNDCGQANADAPNRYTCDHCDGHLETKQSQLTGKSRTSSVYELHRRRVFCASLADWLDDEVPIEWLSVLLELIRDTPNLTWQLVTKRPENWASRIDAARKNIAARNGDDLWMFRWLQGEAPKNVWIITSTENQAMMDLRVPQLMSIPAVVRGISVEPLLERVSIPSGLDWVIVGGESGGKRRDCGVNAIVSVAVECIDLFVPCFVKQDCAFKPGQQGRIPDDIFAIKQFPR